MICANLTNDPRKGKANPSPASKGVFGATQSPPTGAAASKEKCSHYNQWEKFGNLKELLQ